MSAPAAPIDPDRILATRHRISPYLRRTPLLRVEASDFGLSPSPLSFKLELLQRSGSFKVRGAFAHLLLRQIPAAGVVAASGGNHGAAVAYAARVLGVRATIFVPSVSSPAKMERIRSYGAELVVSGDRYAEALEASQRCAEETGALSVHAYDQDETLLGQGTLGPELEEDAPELDSLLVAVGGGGSSGESRPGTGAGSKSSPWSPRQLRRCSAPWRPAGRWTRRPAGSPRIAWHPSGWASGCSGSPRPLWTLGWCW